MRKWINKFLDLTALIQRIYVLEQEVAELKRKMSDDETEKRRTKPRPRDLIKHNTGE